MKKPLTVVLALPLLLLGACTSTYSVEVVNQTNQPVTAEFLARSPEGLLAPIGQPIRLGPGDRGGMGPVTLDANRPIVLRANRPGASDAPPNPVLIDLVPGRTGVEIGQDGTAFGSPIVVRTVPK